MGSGSTTSSIESGGYPRCLSSLVREKGVVEEEEEEEKKKKQNMGRRNTKKRRTVEESEEDDEDDDDESSSDSSSDTAEPEEAKAFSYRSHLPPTRRSQRLESTASLTVIPKRKRLQILTPPLVPDTWSRLLDLTRRASQLPTDQQYKDCGLLPRLLPALEQLDTLIGLEDIKQALTDHVLFYCQQKCLKKPKMCHLVITGPSGCGKTTLAHAIAHLFNRMGLLETDKVVVGTQQNMIGSYVGHTAKMTQEVIDRAMGGCLLIDEAYSLGSSRDVEDSYARNCVDTLNQNLTEHGEEFQCIIVGYKAHLEQYFFAMNPGLKRRFQWTFEVPPCDARHLSQILLKMLQDEELLVEDHVIQPAWFQDKLIHFPHGGGSVENLVSKMKIAHSRRVFGGIDAIKGTITAVDRDQGFQSYVKYEKSQQKSTDGPPEHMYT
jgi:ATPase family associated with various cellular activities (AAA)